MSGFLDLIFQVNTFFIKRTIICIAYLPIVENMKR